MAFNEPREVVKAQLLAHVALDASISSVVESKVNKGIAGIDTIKKSEKV